MEATQNYIKPPVKSAPPLLLLRMISWIGLVALCLGFMNLGRIFYWEVFSDEEYECGYTFGSRLPEGYDCESGFTVYHWLVPLLIAIVLLTLGSRLKKHYYYEVLQGKVVDKDFNVYQYSSSHTLKVQGYNRSGYMTKQWKSVTAGTYEKFKIDDYIDFR